MLLPSDKIQEIIFWLNFCLFSLGGNDVISTGYFHYLIITEHLRMNKKEG